MKGISLYQPFGSLITYEFKTIETRYWYTHYRGPLLISSTQKTFKHNEMKLFYAGHTKLVDKFNEAVSKIKHDIYSPPGCALCMCDLVDCRPMRPDDELEAMVPYDPDRFCWVLKNIKPVESFDIKGRQRIYNLTDNELSKINFGGTYLRI